MDSRYMKFRQATAGAFFLAFFIAACDMKPESTVEPTEESATTPEKMVTEDKSTALEGVEQPKTLAERRALREQLAQMQAKKLPDPDNIQTDETNYTTGEVPTELLDRIIADLVTRAAANRADIEVLHAESLTWNDGSLGCGKPGQVYTQALVPGYRVILGHAGQQFDYRANEKGFFTLCEQPTLTAPGSGSNPPTQ